ncbi:MAG: hypothetical protein QFB87_05605 [Patescibacteria group bacterium]|nr:hypothetical protein [Patescibacteria group bacterium]
MSSPKIHQHLQPKALPKKITNTPVGQYVSTFKFSHQNDLFDVYEQTTVFTPMGGWPGYKLDPSAAKTSTSKLLRVRDIDAYCAAYSIDFNKTKVKYKRDKRDRPKTFFECGAAESTLAYVDRWLVANHLMTEQPL